MLTDAITYFEQQKCFIAFACAANEDGGSALYDTFLDGMHKEVLYPTIIARVSSTNTPFAPHGTRLEACPERV